MFPDTARRLADGDDAAADLDALVDEEAEEGLRCVVVFARDGALRHVAGRCVSDNLERLRRDLYQSANDQLFDLGDRVRMVRSSGLTATSPASGGRLRSARWPACWLTRSAIPVSFHGLLQPSFAGPQAEQAEGDHDQRQRGGATDSQAAEGAALELVAQQRLVLDQQGSPASASRGRRSGSSSPSTPPVSTARASGWRWRDGSPRSTAVTSSAATTRRAVPCSGCRCPRADRRRSWSPTTRRASAASSRSRWRPPAIASPWRPTAWKRHGCSTRTAISC